MNVRDWLIDLAEHNYATIEDGEIVILPIKEDEDG